MDISDKIRYLRTQKLKLTQEEFANKLDLSRNTIKSWENGTIQPSVSRIMMIAWLADVSTDYLIFDECHEQISAQILNETEYSILKSNILFFKELNNQHEK